MGVAVCAAFAGRGLICVHEGGAGAAGEGDLNRGWNVRCRGRLCRVWGGLCPHAQVVVPASVGDCIDLRFF